MGLDFVIDIDAKHNTPAGFRFDQKDHSGSIAEDKDVAGMAE